MNLAVFVHEQRTQHESSFAGCSHRVSRHSVERCEHFDEASITPSQITQVPAHRHQLLVRRVRDDGPLNHDDVTSRFQLRNSRAHSGFTMRRMCEDAARNLTEAEPAQLFAQIAGCA
jgi:hypothetical protein